MKHGIWSWNLLSIFWIRLWLLVKGNGYYEKEFPVIKEYCSGENFHPRCQNDEVILMHRATYGRRRIGKCVKRPIGIDCSEDVLFFLDQNCTGRQECFVQIPSVKLDEEVACLDTDLKPNLEASYTCEKAVQFNGNHCKGPIHVAVASQGSHIVSYAALENDCGSAPWILEAQPGQQLNLTLIVLSRRRHGDIRDRHCRTKYGYVVDLDTQQTTDICNTGTRQTHLLLSHSNRAQIVFESAKRELGFMIKFMVVGCPNLNEPRNAWIDRQGDTTIVGCHHSKQTWHLNCVNSKWIGVIGNCSHRIVIFVICAVAMAISCITIIIGIFCIKRNVDQEKMYQQQVLKADYLRVNKYQDPPSTSVYQSYHDVRSNPASTRREQHYSLGSDDLHNPVHSPIAEQQSIRTDGNSFKPEVKQNIPKDRSSHSIHETAKFFVLDKNTAPNITGIV